MPCLPRPLSANAAATWRRWYLGLPRTSRRATTDDRYPSLGFELLRCDMSPVTAFTLQAEDWPGRSLVPRDSCIETLLALGVSPTDDEVIIEPLAGYIHVS